MAGEQKIHISRALVESLYLAKGGTSLPTNLMIGIRGATPHEPGGDLVVKTPNKPGFYNDAVGLVLGNEVFLYPGTTDAGSMAQIEDSDEDNSKGIFHLNDGIHRVRHHDHQKFKKDGTLNPIPSYLDSRKAWHISTPRQGDNALGWRDLNDTDVRDSGDTIDTTSNAINVHWGAKITGGSALKTPVSIWSVGCLNVVRDYWLTFRKQGYQKLANPAHLLLVDASLLPDPAPVRPLQLEINQNLIPADKLTLWEDPPGKTMTYVRQLLDLVAVSGQPPAYVFKDAPSRLEFSLPAGKKLPLTMKVENGAKRGTAGIRDALTVLDPNISITRSVDENKIIVVSGVVGPRP